MDLTWLYIFKALHIVGFTAWFAGLFYLVRMFVYHREAFDKAAPEKEILTKQFNLMEWRVYKIICNPAMIITLVFGIAMLIYNPEYMKMPWIHVKLTLLVLLIGYHHYCKSVIKKLEKGEANLTSFRLRLMNEVPTLFLLAIVLLAVLRDNANYLYVFGGLFLFGLVMYLIAKAYKKKREG